jgi:hypothetical protein
MATGDAHGEKLNHQGEKARRNSEKEICSDSKALCPGNFVVKTACWKSSVKKSIRAKAPACFGGFPQAFP